MKSMSKAELADKAGVSISTLHRWLQPHITELRKLGYQPSQRVLPPVIVKYIVETFCIDTE